MSKDMGASQATGLSSPTEPCSTVSALTGFDPSRGETSDENANRPRDCTASGDFSIGGEVWPGVSKVLEEMGELGQVLGKLIGSHGCTAHFDGTDLEERLVEELGDLLGAIEFFTQANDLPRTQIFNRKIRKYNLFWEWHGTAAIATETRRAVNAEGGAVHEGAGPKDIAQ